MGIRIAAICILLSLYVLSGSRCKCNPESPTPPRVTLQPSGFGAGDTLATDTVRIDWQGNARISEFRYRFDTLAWSEWTDNTSLRTQLDDGPHTFEIETRWKEETGTSISSIEFYIDAVDGPAVVVSPRYQVVTGDTVSFAIMTESVPGCKMLHLELGNVAAFDAILEEESDSTSAVVLADSNIIDVMLGPSSAPFSSDGAVLRFKSIVASAGMTEIKIVKCVARDSTGNDIGITTLRGGIVER
jgi:hypothetical protein